MWILEQIKRVWNVKCLKEPEATAVTRWETAGLPYNMEIKPRALYTFLFSGVETHQWLRVSHGGHLSFWLAVRSRRSWIIKLNLKVFWSSEHSAVSHRCAWARLHHTAGGQLSVYTVAGRLYANVFPFISKQINPPLLAEALTRWTAIITWAPQISAAFLSVCAACAACATGNTGHASYGETLECFCDGGVKVRVVEGRVTRSSLMPFNTGV